jgi:hypothetical protein
VAEGREVKPLFFLACIVTFGLAYRYRCGFLHETVTRRDTATGMRRCIHPRCGRAYADLHESGELDGAAFLRPTKAGAFFGKDGSRGVERQAR